ncbi:MAG: hypothetical protein Aurels2KO_28280 [Aureliella sp.]
MAQVSISFSADDARARQAHDRLLADQEKVIAKYRAMAGMSNKSAAELRKETTIRKASLKASRESADAARRAANLTRQLQNPQEKFNAAMREAIALKDKGALSSDMLLRRYKQLKAELKVETRALAGNSTAMKEARRLIAASISPLERYKQKLSVITTLHRNGEISARDFASAQRALQTELGKKLDVSQSSDAIEGLAGRVSQFAAAYGGVSTAINAVTQSWQAQLEIQREALSLNDQIARSQQESFKNLANLAPEDKKRVTEEVRRISKIGIPAEFIQTAFGDAYSKGSQFGLQKVGEAVEFAAPLNIQTPANTTTDAQAALAVANATGSLDMRANLGLIKSGGLQSGVVDPRKVAENLTPSIAAGVNSLPDALREQPVAKKEAAITATALFGAFSKLSDDRTGDVTRTAVSQFLSHVGKTFENIPATRADLERKVGSLQESDRVTDVEKWRIDAAKLELEFTQERLTKLESLKVQTREDEQEILRARMREREQVIALNKAVESSTLSDEGREELTQAKERLAGLQGFVDPGLPRKRMEATANNPQLADMLFEKEFGDERFKKLFRLVVRKGDPAQRLFKDARSEISFDPSVHKRLAKDVQNLTPELGLAVIRNKQHAAIEEFLTAPELRHRAQIAETFADTEEKTRPNNFLGKSIAWTASKVTAFDLSSSPVDRAAYLATNHLEARANAIRRDQSIFGASEGEAAKLRLLEDSIRTIHDTLQQFNDTVGKQAEAAEMQLQAAKMQGNAAGRINGAAGKMQGRPRAAAGQVGGDE